MEIGITSLPVSPLSSAAVFTDSCSDFSKTAGHTGNMQYYSPETTNGIDEANSTKLHYNTHFLGKNVFGKTSGMEAPASVEYAYDNAQAFSVTVYGLKDNYTPEWEYFHFYAIRVYAAGAAGIWREIPYNTTKSGVAQTPNPIDVWWTAYTVTNKNRLPTGTNRIKVEIGSMDLNYCFYVGNVAISDSFWTRDFIEDCSSLKNAYRTDNVTAFAVNPDFNGSSTINVTDTSRKGSLVYKYENGNAQSVELTLYGFNNNGQENYTPSWSFLIRETGVRYRGLTLYSCASDSGDINDWTPVPFYTESLGTIGNFTKFKVTSARLPGNTNFIRADLFPNIAYCLSLAGLTIKPSENTCTTSYTYDSFDRPVQKTITELNFVETHSYEDVYNTKYARHQVTVEGDVYAPATTSATVTDMAGQIYQEFTGADETARYTYNKLGHKTSVTDAAGNTASFAVDWGGRTRSVTRQVGAQTLTSTAVYNALGNKIAATDCNGNKTTYMCDALGRTVKQTAPFDSRNAVTKFYYDAAGNLVTQKVLCQRPNAAEDWRDTRFVYDARGRQREVYQYEDTQRQKYACTHYFYDGKGNKTEMRTGITHASADYASVRYAYDRFGNVLTITDALNQVERHTYDVIGRHLTKTDRNGSVARYIYDRTGRLIREAVTAADERGTITSARESAYTRTGQTREKTASESSDGAAFAFTAQNYYNNKGQLVKQLDPDGVEKQYTYDSRGNRASFTLLRSGTSQVILYYEYDAAGRLARVRRDSSTGTVMAEYTYDPNGNRTRLWRPEKSVETSYTYNKANLVTQLVNKQGGTVLSQFDYTYYLDGNQASKTEGGSTTQYLYDRLGRLVEENDSKWSSIQYQYDRFHNRAKMTVAPTGQQLDKPNETVYSYDKNNRLLRETKTGDNIVEIRRHKYDKSGNHTSTEWEATGPNASQERSKLAFVYETQGGFSVLDMRRYNGFGQLVRVWHGSLDIRYQYRQDNLRHQKTVKDTSHSTAVSTTHCWDGQNMVMEVNAQNNSVKARYLRGSGLLAQQIDGAVWYYTHNAHGDVIQRIPATGSATPKYEYDAFGNQRNAVATDPNPFRYCGEYFDLSSGEYYLRARTYNPANGRFTSSDPARSGLNWYTYCEANPVMRTDPSGLMSKSASDAMKAAYAWAAAQTKATALSHNRNKSQQAAYSWAAAQSQATNLWSQFNQAYPNNPVNQSYLQQAIYVDSSGSRSSVPVNLPSARSSMLIMPFVVTSQSFPSLDAYNRGLGYYSGHEREGERNAALDFGIPEGTFLTAPDNGVIKDVVNSFRREDHWFDLNDKRMATYGNYILVEYTREDGSKYEARYAHLLPVSNPLEVGNNVYRGDIIGYTGHTGNSSGPHLHFETYVDGARYGSPHEFLP